MEPTTSTAITTLQTQLCPFKYTRTPRLCNHQVPFPFSVHHPTYPCGYCKLSVEETDYAVGCDGACNAWFHCICIGMPLSELAFYEKEDWYCDKCLQGGYKSSLTYTKYLLNECMEPFDELEDSGIGLESEEIVHAVEVVPKLKPKNKRLIKKRLKPQSKLNYVDIDIKSFTPVRILNDASIAEWRKKIYKCSACSFTNPSPCVVKAHRKVHRRGKITCPHCEYCTHCKDRLDDHIALLHGGTPRFECDKCNFKTTREHHLKSHTASNCSARPHQCQQCDRRFRRVDSLREHVVIAHTDKSRFKCTMCDFQCHRVSTWNRHKQTHTNLRHSGDLRPYHECQQCELCYKRRYQLTTHVMLKHEGPSGSRD